MTAGFFPLTISFPRFVRLENTRLTLTYWCLSLATFLFVIIAFVFSEGYNIEKMPHGAVQVWPTNWNPTEGQRRELNDVDAGKDHCLDPQKYEFCDSPDCSSWSARELQCVDICAGGLTQECMMPSERFIKTDGGIFFPTFFAESTTVRGNGRRQDTQNKWRMVKGVEDMGIGFQHEYDIYTPANLFYPKNREKGSSWSLDSIYGDGLLTVLEDVNGNEIDRWQPGQMLTLTLQQILKAGKISLDSVYRDEDIKIGRNFLEGAQVPDGILTRLAGAEIILELSYQNPASSRTPDWSGPVCYLSIHSRPVWTSHPVSHLTDHFGSQRFRYYHGVKIQFRIAGSFTWISYELIASKLAQLLVFLACVKWVIFYFSIWCLGVVSKVYKGLLFQEASFNDEACGLTARLASYSSAFDELMDTTHGISESRLLSCLQAIFARNELDEKELQRFVHFVFKRMATRNGDFINGEGFSHACSHGEALRVKTLVDLFDPKRKKGFLESVFAGPTRQTMFSSDQKEQELENVFSKESLPPKSVQLSLRRSTSTLKLEDDQASSLDNRPLSVTSDNRVITAMDTSANDSNVFSFFCSPNPGGNSQECSCGGDPCPRNSQEFQGFCSFPESGSMCSCGTCEDCSSRDVVCSMQSLTTKPPEEGEPTSPPSPPTKTKSTRFRERGKSQSSISLPSQGPSELSSIPEYSLIEHDVAQHNEGKNSGEICGQPMCSCSCGPTSKEEVRFPTHRQWKEQHRKPLSRSSTGSISFASSSSRDAFEARRSVRMSVVSSPDLVDLDVANGPKEKRFSSTKAPDNNSLGRSLFLASAGVNQQPDASARPDGGQRRSPDGVPRLPLQQVKFGGTGKV